MKALRQKTMETTALFQSRGFRVVEMWEHVFKTLLRTDHVLKSFVSNLEVIDRLNPRDAFFGGRTNAVKLMHEGPAKYIDFTSLYPWCNKYCR